jgi:hypothetical protein
MVGPLTSAGRPLAWSERGARSEIRLFLKTPGSPAIHRAFCEDDGMDGEDLRLAYDMDASFML